MKTAFLQKTETLEKGGIDWLMLAKDRDNNCDTSPDTQNGNAYLYSSINGNSKNMFNLLNRLFRRKNPVPPFDIEKAVGHYLLTLPRCSSRVLAFSKSYQDKRFNYEMIVNATSLSAWAVQIDFGSGGWTDSDKATRKAFDLWLRLANLNDNSVTTLPKMFFDEIGEHHESFLEMRGNEVFCHECSKMIQMPIQKITEEKYNVMRDEWHCPNGHCLYQKVTEIYCSGRGFPMDYLEYEENDLSVPSFLRKKPG